MRRPFFAAELRYEEFKVIVVTRGHGGEGKTKEMETTCEGCSKLLNTNDTFVTGNRVDNVSVVIRNDKGGIIVVKIISLFRVTSPRHAKILTISNGFLHFELETDALAIVDANR